MKNFTIVSILLIAGVAFSQEVEEKKLQAGLLFGTGLNLNKAATKRMQIDGVGNSINIGLGINYRLNNTIGIHTGLNVDFEKNYIKPSESTSPTYYYYNDTKILRSSEIDANSSLFQYTNRTQKPIYLTLPTELLFRTKYFGYVRFYGQFGLRTSILLGNKMDDKGFFIENTILGQNKVAGENTTMRAARDMNFLRSNVGFSLGAEWNFSGSTSLIAQMGYYYGFIPLYRDNKTKNQTLFYNEDNGSATFYSNDVTQSQLVLKIGIMF